MNTITTTDNYKDVAARLSSKEAKSLRQCERGLREGTKPTRRLIRSGKLEARVNRSLRVVLDAVEDGYVLLDICTHDELDKRW